MLPNSHSDSFTIALKRLYIIMWIWHDSLRDYMTNPVLFSLHTKLVITTHESGLLTYFLTRLMLCVLILYTSGSLKSTPSNRFLRNFSWQFLFSLRILARNLLRVSRWRYISSYFILIGDVWSVVWTMASLLICQHTTYEPTTAYTYIHNWSLQPFSQDYWPSFSHINMC